MIKHDFIIQYIYQNEVRQSVLCSPFSMKSACAMVDACTSIVPLVFVLKPKRLTLPI